MASRRFLPAHLAPVPAHLLDCLSCQHIRGGQQSLYNNKLVTVYYAYQLQNGDVVTFGKWSCGQNVAVTDWGCCYVWQVVLWSKCGNYRMWTLFYVW